MPCRSDYQEPQPHEIRNQETARLAVYLLAYLEEPISRELSADAHNAYTSKDYAPLLCDRIRKLKKENLTLFNDVVYDARNRQSRKLADWWEAHETWDRKREAQEAKDAAQRALALQARSKLTNNEYNALRELIKSGTKADRDEIDS